MVKGYRNPICGVCGFPKKEGKGRAICPECSRKASLAFYHKNKRPLTESQKRSKYKNRKKVRASGLTNQKVYAMKSRYGITEKDFLDMAVKQDNKCGVCKHPLTKDALVDHNHETGYIRGVLCRKCNFAIGLLRDCPDILKSAIEYLNQSSKLKTA